MYVSVLVVGGAEEGVRTVLVLSTNDYVSFSISSEGSIRFNLPNGLTNEGCYHRISI